jgi:hypothetical protein
MRSIKVALTLQVARDQPQVAVASAISFLIPSQSSPLLMAQQLALVLFWQRFVIFASPPVVEHFELVCKSD